MSFLPRSVAKFAGPGSRDKYVDWLAVVLPLAGCEERWLSREDSSGRDGGGFIYSLAMRQLGLV